MACNNIGTKVVCDSADEAMSVDRRMNGDFGDSALDTLAGIPQFFNATAKYATMTDSFFGENRPWKDNFLSADIGVFDNPLVRLHAGLPINISAGIWNTATFGYFKEGLDAVGVENHLSPPPSTKYETYNYYNGILLLVASALDLYWSSLKAAPKATTVSQVATTPERAASEAAALARVEGAVPQTTASAPKYVMDYADPPTPAPLTGNPGRIIAVDACPSYPEGMLIKGWNAVEEALRNYGTEVRHSADTTTKLVSDSMQEHGPFGAGLALEAIGRGVERGGGFIETMLAEARASIRKSGYWYGSYEYEALGTPFFKTSLTIAKVGNDLYTLDIGAAYVGKAPEIAMAQTLGVPRVLKDVGIYAKLEPVAKAPTFVVNFGDILARLEVVLGKLRVTAEEAAKTAGKNSKWGDKETVVIYKDTKVTIELKLEHVKEPVPGRTPFSVDGCLVSGTCSSAHSLDGNQYFVPSIKITVKFAQKGAEYEPANYPSLLNMAERIKRALEGTTEERALPPHAESSLAK